MTDYLSLRGITKSFGGRGGLLSRFLRPSTTYAVSGIDLDIAKGEILGIVGESGCGKTTLGRIMAGIHPQSGGTISCQNPNSLDIQMIFQDPSASLNPRLRVKNILSQAPLHHGLIRKADRVGFVGDLMKKVGLDPAYGDRYPHQLSGGQRQRVEIARALSVNPKVLICDEPVSALDVSIQAQIINLFKELQEKLSLTYVFISHDLGVVGHISDRVAIMYLGRIVELADTRTLFEAPQHPYTKMLLDHMPDLKRHHHKFDPIVGEMPSPLNPPPGCAFNPRCPVRINRCMQEMPQMNDTGVACHLVDDKG